MVMRVAGADELVDSMAHAADEFDDLTAPARAAGNVVERDAARFAPRRSGALSRSVKATVSGNNVTVTAGNAAVPYAGVHEFGWRKHNIRASHYMRKSLDTNSDAVVKLYQNEVDDILDDVKGA